MTEWKQLREHPKVRQALQVICSGIAACLLATASFNGVRIPLNAALSAALPPLGGLAVLAGSAVTYALTGMLKEQPILLCTLALTTILRWILGVNHTPRAAAMLAACSTFLAAVIFGMAGMISGRDWLLWSLGSVISGGLAACIRRVLMRFEAGLPVRLLETDSLPFSVCCMLGLSVLCTFRLVMISFGDLAAGFLIGALGSVITSRIGAAIAGTLGIAVLIAALGVKLLFCRCPHCGRSLDRSRGDFCPYCGRRIDE